MGNIFNLDSKFMHAARKIADLMILNVLTLLCCIPIVTIGASLTAMYNVVLKIYRDEESYVTRQFFRAFRENFKQAAVITLLYGLFVLILGIDFILLKGNVVQLPQFLRYALWIMVLLAMISHTWVYVLQSRYENTVGVTIRNSFLIGISRLLYTVMMILLDLSPLLILYYFMSLFPVVILLGLTAPAFFKTLLFSRVFDKLEGIDRSAAEIVSGTDETE